MQHHEQLQHHEQPPRNSLLDRIAFNNTAIADANLLPEVLSDQCNIERRESLIRQAFARFSNPKPF